MTNLATTELILVIAAIAALAVLIRWALWRVKGARLMRCPEEGSIAIVTADRVTPRSGGKPEVRVRSCELWPRRKECARGCLARYAETTPGYRINAAALRPFEQE